MIQGGQVVLKGAWAGTVLVLLALTGAVLGAPAAGAPASAPVTQPGGQQASLLDIPARHLAELEAFLKEYLPDVHERVERLRRDDPAQARHELFRAYRLWWRVRQYPPEVRQAAVACNRLERSIYETAREIRQTDTPARKAALVEDLRRILGRHFDQDQIVKEYHVQGLTKLLADLKGQVADRAKNRAALIEQRLAGLLQPAPRTQPTTAQRRPPPGRGGPPERQGELTAFLKEHAPQFLEQLQRLDKEDPPQAQRQWVRAYGLVRRVRQYPPEVRDAAIASHALNVSIEQVVGRIRAMPQGADRTGLLGSLRDLLARQFDQEQVVQEYRVKFLTRQLAELQAEVQHRRQERSKVIADWLARLLEPPVGRPSATLPAEAKVAP